MVINWWKETSDSQEQLWGVGMAWLLCHSHCSTEHLKRWGGNRLAGEARLVALTGKSHLHSLHTSSNSAEGCSLGQGLSVGFRYVLGRSRNNQQLPQVLPGAGHQLSHVWRLREPSGCADPMAGRGQGEDKWRQAEGKVSWGWSETSRQHGLASRVWK